ncbi:BZ3500_MvSof-1268-A1-R1_Chr7-1g09258 [Microbotryum saponariae]|uniref:BZ3500_MvSof-1268-A1-R1_Chr7-1g09258 protein n=1 Tax=Microbotryum saponariae TaxID=289078 RepID=A0A2X0L8F9_9BASI|nr:BZ3501_MvSof-1269-A2-R1_Chr7-1g08963 [Microbotryum saponariae]SDA03101.1 BZ3500_MvSof-1268-A1-R1_Chr7-1g09258 [Microbotryum saponariae]
MSLRTLSRSSLLLPSMIGSTSRQPLHACLSSIPCSIVPRSSTSPSSSSFSSCSSACNRIAPAPSATSAPRPSRPAYQQRELPSDRELPRLKVSLPTHPFPPPLHRLKPTLLTRQSRTPLYLSVALLSATTWGLFLFYATNAERSNSSVIGSLAFQLRTSKVVADFLGNKVHLPALIGEFRTVKGNINMLAGRIDVQFRVKGDKAGGIAIFTSVRRGKEGRFEVLRWKIIRDDGQTLDLQAADPRAARRVIEEVVIRETGEKGKGESGVVKRVV